MARTRLTRAEALALTPEEKAARRRRQQRELYARQRAPIVAAKRAADAAVPELVRARAQAETLARKRAKQREYGARWQAKYPGRRNEVSRASYHKYRAKNIARVQAWQARNPEYKVKRNAAAARYSKRHPEKRAEWTNRWREKNPERYRLATLARAVAWNAAHPDERRVYINRARAKRKTAPTRPFTPADWAAHCALFAYRCVYCFRLARPLTQDHLEPLVRGGTHSLDNIVPACRSCNARKHAMTLLRFLWKRSA
jgi:5-methylcytosine-specific restriction endonuclease McrA